MHLVTPLHRNTYLRPGISRSKALYFFNCHHHVPMLCGPEGECPKVILRPFVAGRDESTEHEHAERERRTVGRKVEFRGARGSLRLVGFFLAVSVDVGRKPAAQRSEERG